MAQTQLLRLINQLFEAEKKAARIDGTAALQKNLERMRGALEDMGFIIVNPLGNAYNESRTDCECSIAGDASKPLFISDVLKPAVYETSNDGRSLVQKAVVIAENRVVR
jgi:hypothetical protein